MRLPDHVAAKKAFHLIRARLLGAGIDARDLREAIQTVLDWEQDMVRIEGAGDTLLSLPADVAHARRSYDEGKCEGIETAIARLIHEGRIQERLEDIERFLKGAITDAG